MRFLDQSDKVYAKILSDGSVRIPAKDGDPNGVSRVVETSDGQKRTYFELVKRGLVGKISKIEFKENDFGKQMNIEFAKDLGEKNTVILSLSCNSNFATNLMEKLPNVDFDKEVSLSPYSLENENGKSSKGIVVWQSKGADNDAKEKVPSYFKEKDKKGNNININGYPDPEKGGKGFDKDDWKMYFTKVKKFLVQYTEENIIPKIGFNTDIATKVEDLEEVVSSDDIKIEDIPL